MKNVKNINIILSIILCYIFNKFNKCFNKIIIENTALDEVTNEDQ